MVNTDVVQGRHEIKPRFVDKFTITITMTTPPHTHTPPPPLLVRMYPQYCKQQGRLWQGIVTAAMPEQPSPGQQVHLARDKEGHSVALALLAHICRQS